MENLLVYTVFVMGILMIIKGGDLFVESAIWIAQKTGIPTFLIGATVVSLATTLPELLVSSIASYEGNYDIAISNAVGSVICNTGLILAISLLASPTKIHKKSFILKGSYLMFSALLLLFFSRDGIVSKIEGIYLFGYFILFMIINIVESRKIQSPHTINNVNLKITSSYKNISQFIGGAILIIIGSRLLVDNGVTIANILGIPQRIISLTLIALGTSLPELITTISSLIKKQSGLSLGNIIGANILNFLFVIGSSVMISSNGLIIGNLTYTFDLPVSLVLIASLLTSGLIYGKLTRKLGVFLVFIYAFYMISVFQISI